jgi:phosphatidate cytidylyltransferase
MNAMYSISITSLYQTLAGNFALLLAATGFVELFRHHWSRATYVELMRRIRTWWILFVLFSVALVASRTAFICLMGLVSFLALKEYLSLIETRRADRSTLLLAYGLVPLHYSLIGLETTGTYPFVAPIIGFLLLQGSMALHGNTEDYLPAAAKLFWGLLICVFCVSYVAAIRVVAPDPGGAGLVFFLVVLTEFNDVAQYVWGKLIGNARVCPQLSPGKTWGGLLGGVLTTTLTAAGLGPFLTPFDLPQSLAAGLLIGTFGFVGDLNVSAVKRYLNIKDSGQLLPGHGGVLDRIDSLIFTAPALFYFYTWLNHAGYLS